MAGNAEIQSVASKFQAWAGSLSSDEQATLAQWWSSVAGDEVSGFSAEWWQAPGAWAQAWTGSWNWS
jgi:hypothetical protein